MSGLTVYAGVAQGSAEWLELRRGILTASTVGQLITPSTLKVAGNDMSRALVCQLVAERITGWVQDSYQSFDMVRGALDEPVARGVYGEHYAPVTEVGFMVRHFDGADLGYSPDGLVGDDGLIEIKSRSPKDHLATILADKVPAKHMAQIQAGLLVSGRQWLDYISFCGGMPLWVERVQPDQRWVAAIRAALAGFEATAAKQIAADRDAVAGLATTERTTYDLDMVI